ncbi:MAG: hypothetical protein JNM96_04320 [Bacteroidia bacterium]|nr:hypothetical protein [Bacteroidia bacterium]
MMKFLSVLVLAGILASCNVPKDTDVEIPLNKYDVIEALAESDKEATDKLLLKASFTEPFMYAEIYTNRVVFSFPEKDTLVWKHNFDSLSFTKDFNESGKEGEHSIQIKIENKPCTHPGSGEKWSKKADFIIDNINYTGCAGN